MSTMINLTDPYVTLDYGDRYLDCQDHLTCAVCVDLFCDLHIYVSQPAHNIIAFENSRDLTLALLYLTRYTHFSVRAHQYH